MKASENIFPKLQLSESPTPATPPAGVVILYYKADGLLYSLDSAGVESAIGSGGGGGGDGGDGGITVINEQVGTTYTLAATDSTACVRITNAAASTLVVPADATAAIAVKRIVMILQGGAGAITITAEPGVTLESPNGVSTTAVGDFRTLFKRAANTWVVG